MFVAGLGISYDFKGSKDDYARTAYVMRDRGFGVIIPRNSPGDRPSERSRATEKHAKMTVDLLGLSLIGTAGLQITFSLLLAFS